jgi:transketolase
MTNRERIIEISVRHKLSHMGSCLTALPIIEEIYVKKKPEDKFVLSAGHAHLAHAVVIEASGGISAEESIGRFGIHCDRKAGCDCSTGSLGQGLPVAVGMALAERDKDIYCLVSDGETAEGSCYEALEVAHQHKLTNLHIFVNANGMSAYDYVNTFHLRDRLEPFDLDIQIRETDANLGTWARGLNQHYKVADKDLR